MPHICIGIHVHSEPERLHATLASLRSNTARDVEVILLPDGPDPPTVAALAHLPDLPQLGTPDPQGTAACFNRLAASSAADVIVLLESGCLVGPTWLDRLLAALAADPYHGLAGPSTNRAWNEQGAFPHSGSSLAEVARTAEVAAQRFGTGLRTLEPLYSLADFCYAVRREVISAIGGADPAYGLGPCWEMDYNIRAARAGFRGIWVGGAYVQRSPFTQRRRREERLRFEASKQHYQDKFCALRLRGATDTYESHCRGEACVHYAPVELISLHMPLPALSTVPNSTDIHVQCDTIHVAAALGLEDTTHSASGATDMHRSLEPAVAGCATDPHPLVSCIMPTGGRVSFALQAIRMFLRQSYPARELIIVDDGDDGLDARLPQDGRIRYVRVSPGQSIGAKRNRACELARGMFIAHWDDDDWYADDRLQIQLAPLIAGSAEISALSAEVFFDLPRWAFWICTPALHRRLFVEDVHGGTLAFRRDIWGRLARYPDRSLAEDALFLRQVLRGGARLARLANQGRFIYVRHGSNSWAFACGDHLDPAGWLHCAEPALPAEDRAFYAAQALTMSTKSLPALPISAMPTPLVSCIMPTADRRPLVAQAITYFQRQDYRRAELIVIDDGIDPVDDLIPPDPRVRYVRLLDRQSVGAKRNLACEAAQGEIILHWDDDDWMSPTRISYQVAQLLAGGADICGLSSLCFYDLTTGRSWRYTYPPGGRPWVAGNTLCYTRATWRRTPFANIDNGEDTRFVWSSPVQRVLPLADDRFCVAIVHGRNISPKRYQHSRWQEWPRTDLQARLDSDWDFYMGLQASSRSA